MSPIRYRAPVRYRESESSAGSVLIAVGAIAGLAAGVLLVQRFGGLSALTHRLRERFATTDAESDEIEQFRGGESLDAQGYDDEDDMADDDGAVLEERVLEAFRNDPILSERAVDIGAIGRGIIELTGWVHADDESTHAMTLTRGVPGVDTVINRLVVREDEDRMEESGRRYTAGDPGATPGHWEGQQVGTGRPRQGTSADLDRHADPKPVLEDRWLSEDQALREAADDLEHLAERRARAKEAIEGDRTGGAPIAPTGVPKADHVADPMG